MLYLPKITIKRKDILSLLIAENKTFTSDISKMLDSDVELEFDFFDSLFDALEITANQDGKSVCFNKDVICLRDMD